MTDSKLTSLLKVLSEDEFKQFEKFVDSPYYNKGRDLTPFVKVLKTFYPEFNHKNLNNEFLFRKLFPGKKYDNVRSENLIRTLSSHLFRICKEFLIQIELEHQRSSKKYFLLNQLRRKKLYKEFDREYNSLNDEGETIGKGSVGYFVDQYLLNAVKRDCSLNRDDFGNSADFTVRASENILTAALISCFKFEDEKNLREAFNIKVRENILQPVLDNLNYDDLLPALKEKRSPFYPYIEIFYTIYRMNKFKNTTDHYYKLKELLKTHSALFGQAENYVLWNTMLTYAGINKLGNKEVFDIHKYILEHNVYKLSAKENFHIVLFRNIVLTASGIGEYKWLEEFIPKYSDELHQNHRDNMREYSMAYLYYTKSEFEKALDYLLNVEYNLFLYKIDIRVLRSKIYYELGYYEEGLSLVTASLSYLKTTNELPEFRKQSIGNFFKCLKALINIKSGSAYKREDLYELKLKAKDNLYIGFTDWLMEKIEEIELRRR